MKTFLKKNDADIEAQDKKGMTAAHLAAWHGHKDVITALNACGANMDAQDKQGRTPAHMAVRKGRINAIRTLSECGANMDAKDVGGRTPTHLAAERGHKNCIKALKKCGANLDIPMSDGKTPIQIALKLGKDKAVALFQDYGITLPAAANGQSEVSAVSNNSVVGQTVAASALQHPTEILANVAIRIEQHPELLPEGARANFKKRGRSSTSQNSNGGGFVDMIEAEQGQSDKRQKTR